MEMEGCSSTYLDLDIVPSISSSSPSPFSYCRDREGGGGAEESLGNYIVRTLLSGGNSSLNHVEDDGGLLESSGHPVQENEEEVEEEGTENGKFDTSTSPVFQNKKQFITKMEETIKNTVNECISILQKDPREYHPFYLRIFKFTTVGKQLGFIKSEKEVDSLWCQYDNYAADQFHKFQKSPEIFKDFNCEHSPYLNYLLTKKVIFQGKELVLELISNAKKYKRFDNAESIVRKFRRDWQAAGITDSDVRENLNHRLAFFQHVKIFTFPADVETVNKLWHHLVNGHSKPKSEVPLNAVEVEGKRTRRERKPPKRFEFDLGAIYSKKQEDHIDDEEELQDKKKVPIKKKTVKNKEPNLKKKVTVIPDGIHPEMWKPPTQNALEGGTCLICGKVLQWQLARHVREVHFKVRPKKRRKYNKIEDFNEDENEPEKKKINNCEDSMEEGGKCQHCSKVLRNNLKGHLDRYHIITPDGHVFNRPKPSELKDLTEEERKDKWRWWTKLRRTHRTEEEKTRDSQRLRERYWEKIKNMTPEQLEDFRRKNRFQQFQKRLERQNLPEEEKKRLSTLNFIKNQAWLSRKDKEWKAQKLIKIREKARARRERMTKEEREEERRKHKEYRESLSGEKLQKYKNSLRGAVKRYFEKMKRERPEMYFNKTKGKWSKFLDYQRSRVANETPVQREARLLRYRINQAKRRCREEMEGEEGVTEMEIEKRLKEVEEDVRSRPRRQGQGPSQYKPRLGARKPHKMPKPPKFEMKEEVNSQNQVPELQKVENSIIVQPLPRQQEEEEVQVFEVQATQQQDPMVLDTCPIIISPIIPPPPLQIQAPPRPQIFNPPAPQFIILTPFHEMTTCDGQTFTLHIEQIAVPQTSMSFVQTIIPITTMVASNNTTTMVASNAPPTFEEDVPNPSPSSYHEDVGDSCDYSNSTYQSVQIQEVLSVPALPLPPLPPEMTPPPPPALPPSPIPTHQMSLDELINGPFSTAMKSDVTDVSSTEPEEPIASPEPEPPTPIPAPTPTMPPLTLPPTPPSRMSSICDECGKTFTTAYSLEQHKNAIHAVDPSVLTCPKCNHSCTSTVSLWNHFSTKHLEDIDSLPTDIFPSRPPGPPRAPNEPYKQIRSDRNNPHFCDICGKSFVQKCTLDDHIRRVHEGKGHYCDICSRDQQSAAKLWRHKVERHNLSDLPPPPGVPAVTCEFCKEIIMRGYEQHVKKRHPEHFEEFSKSYNPEQGTAPRRTLAEKVNCPHCPSIVKQKLLNRHIRNMHSNRPKYPCPECGFQFKRLDQMKFHFRQYHAVADIEKKLEAKNLLKVHSNRNFTATCLICQQEIPSKILVRAHFVKEHHNIFEEAGVASLPIFGCTFCPEKFAKETQLKGHMETIHQDQLFTCQHCGIFKYNQVELSAHERMHRHKDLRNMRKLGKCTFCNFDAAMVTKVEVEEEVPPQTHPRGHLEGLIREHVRNEHPDKYFPCVNENCWIFCVTPEGLQNHLARCQANGMLNSKSFVEKEVNGLGVYCPECGGVYKFYQMQKHLKIVHKIKEKMEYPCDICKGRLFKCRRYYVGHMHLVHQVPFEELLDLAPDGDIPVEDKPKGRQKKAKKQKEGMKRGKRGVARRKRKIEDIEEEEDEKEWKNYAFFDGGGGGSGADPSRKSRRISEKRKKWEEKIGVKLGIGKKKRIGPKCKMEEWRKVEEEAKMKMNSIYGAVVRGGGGDGVKRKRGRPKKIRNEIGGVGGNGGGIRALLGVDVEKDKRLLVKVEKLSDDLLMFYLARRVIIKEEEPEQVDFVTEDDLVLGVGEDTFPFPV